MYHLWNLRKNDVFSQQELFELLDAPQSAISKYELGIQKTPLWVAEKIRDIFDLTLQGMWDASYRGAS